MSIPSRIRPYAVEIILSCLKRCMRLFQISCTRESLRCCNSRLNSSVCSCIRDHRYQRLKCKFKLSWCNLNWFLVLKEMTWRVRCHHALKYVAKLQDALPSLHISRRMTCRINCRCLKVVAAHFLTICLSRRRGTVQLRSNMKREARETTSATIFILTSAGPPIEVVLKLINGSYGIGLGLLPTRSGALLSPWGGKIPSDTVKDAWRFVVLWSHLTPSSSACGASSSAPRVIRNDSGGWRSASSGVQIAIHSAKAHAQIQIWKI